MVEWNVLGALSDGRRWRGQFEFEWQLVSEWEPVAAVLDPAAEREFDAAQRGRSQCVGVVYVEASDYDELAGNDDQWIDYFGWEPDQLG